MAVLELIAIDPAHTKKREDGFMLEINPKEGVLRRLTIACVVPPWSIRPIEEFDFLQSRFHVRRYSTKHGSNKPHIDLLEHGLTQREQDVLAVIYEFRSDGTFVEQIHVTKGRITPLTYAQFREHPEFSETEKLIEEFIIQDPHILFRYKNEERAKNWEIDSPEYRLIAAMMDMFNKTCSSFASKKGMPTLFVSKGTLYFKTLENGRVATFNAPFRKPVGWINTRNLIAFTRGTHLVFEKQRVLNLGLRVYS